MPQYRYYKVHIADGFTDDCDELIYKCSHLETLDFNTFSNVWKEMNFPFIYQGRQSGAEIAELSEEVIHIAKRCMLANTSNFKISKTGLYLVYALLTQQPYTNFAWLRITPDDVPALRRIETTARREKQYDVLYILGTVLIKYTQFHATERERGFDSTLKKYMDGCTSLDKFGLRSNGVFLQQNDELDMIKDLGVIARRYAQVRNTVTDVFKFGPSINYINENLPTELHTSLRNVMNGFDEGHTESMRHHESVQSIKQKAMVMAVNPMAHLTSAEEKKTNKSPQKKSDITTKAGKIKTCSPTKTTSSPLKRNQLTFATKPKKPKMFFLESIESDAELNLDNFDKETDKPRNDNDLSELIISDIDDNVSETEDNDASGKLDVNKDTLPAIVHTKVGEQYCEIEILDYATNKEVPVEKAITDMLKTTDTEELSKQAKCLIHSKNEDLSKQAELIDSKNEGANDCTTGTSKNNKNMDIKVEQESNVPKRKRPKLKSKLRKMGMMSLANFSEDD